MGVQLKNIQTLRARRPSQRRHGPERESTLLLIKTVQAEGDFATWSESRRALRAPALTPPGALPPLALVPQRFREELSPLSTQDDPGLGCFAFLLFR